MNLSSFQDFDTQPELIALLQKVGFLEIINDANNYRFSEWIRTLDRAQIDSLTRDFQSQIAIEYPDASKVNLLTQWEPAYHGLIKLMEKYDPKLINLTKLMKARFDKLKIQNHKAFVFDVDGNLTKKMPVVLPNGTQRIEAVLVEEIMEKLLHILVSGKVVLLITGRMSKVDEEIKNLGESDVEAILVQLRAYLDTKVVDEDKKTRLLSNLYLTSENGLGKTTNGFRSDEVGFKRFDEEFFPKMMKRQGWKNDPTMNQKLTNLLNEIEFDGMRLASERMFKFKGKPEILPELRKQIIEKITDAGIWLDDRMEVVLAGEVIDVLYYRVNKFSSLVFLAEELGIKDDEKGVVIKSGDNADPFSNDFPLVSQPWSMSADKYDPFNPFMVALALISGQEKGADSTLWALEQLGI